MEDDEYTYLKKKIHRLLNIDLDGYKDHQMKRRLDAFISRAQAPGVAAYCKTLENDSGQIWVDAAADASDGSMVAPHNNVAAAMADLTSTRNTIILTPGRSEEHTSELQSH